MRSRDDLRASWRVSSSSSLDVEAESGLVRDTLLLADVDGTVEDGDASAMLPSCRRMDDRAAFIVPSVAG